MVVDAGEQVHLVLFILRGFSVWHRVVQQKFKVFKIFLEICLKLSRMSARNEIKKSPILAMSKRTNTLFFISNKCTKTKTNANVLVQNIIVA